VRVADASGRIEVRSLTSNSPVLSANRVNSNPPAPPVRPDSRPALVTVNPQLLRAHGPAVDDLRLSNDGGPTSSVQTGLPGSRLPATVASAPTTAVRVGQVQQPPEGGACRRGSWVRPPDRFGSVARSDGGTGRRSPGRRPNGAGTTSRGGPPRTHQRRGAVADLRSDFRSAQQIHDLIKLRGERVGLTTIYRFRRCSPTRPRLTCCGETSHRRCSTGLPHHPVCRQCGRTVELDGPAFEQWPRRSQQTTTTRPAATASRSSALAHLQRIDRHLLGPDETGSVGGAARPA